MSASVSAHPGQNGVGERAFHSLTYERLYHQQIDNVLDLVGETGAYRTEVNTIRPTKLCPGTGPQTSAMA